MVELDERKRAILCAVVEEYTLVCDRLRVSPATIRSAMAGLEEMGLLTHPHTSAGRMPTDRCEELQACSLMRVLE